MIIKAMLQRSIIFIAEKLYQKKRAPEERNITPHYPVEIVKFQKDIDTTYMSCYLFFHFNRFAFNTNYKIYFTQHTIVCWK